MTNVFRSADEDAEADARAVHELLTSQGMEAVLLDDSAPGVPSGVWEVQTPAANVASAEQSIRQARLPDSDLSEVSGSAAFDVETVFRAHGGTNAEMQAMSVKSMLESSGIATVLVGDSVLPNLSFEVQVAKEQAGEARRMIEQAEVNGAEAADEEERSSETPLNP